MTAYIILFLIVFTGIFAFSIIVDRQKTKGLLRNYAARARHCPDRRLGSFLTILAFLGCLAFMTYMSTLIARLFRMTDEECRMLHELLSD